MKKLKDLQIAIEEEKKRQEELNKEDLYIYNKLNEALHMGAKAQSLAYLEVYKIIENRIKSQEIQCEYV